jgi:hypothetical protein
MINMMKIKFFEKEIKYIDFVGSILTVIKKEKFNKDLEDYFNKFAF